MELNIPTGIPLVYELDDELRPLRSYYLGDPEAAKKAAEAVAKQSKAKCDVGSRGVATARALPRQALDQARKRGRDPSRRLATAAAALAGRAGAGLFVLLGSTGLALLFVRHAAGEPAHSRAER